MLVLQPQGLCQLVNLTRFHHRTSTHGKISTPYLETLSADAWAGFVAEFESCKARDGDIPARSLVSAAVLRLITLHVAGSVQPVEGKEKEQPASSGVSTRRSSARLSAQSEDSSDESSDVVFLAAVSSISRL